jgi:RNA polymerase-binding transcription factor DksA
MPERERLQIELEKAQAELDQLNKLLEHKADYAGTYGMCERCHGEIDPERLKILPHTTLCIECAKAERQITRR